MTQPTPTSSYIAAGGTFPNAVLIEHFDIRDPTVYDVNYSIQQRWFNKTLNNEWILVGFTNAQGFILAVWEPISSATTVELLEGNTGGPVAPNVSHIINTIGTSPITVTGDAATNTLTWSSDGTVATSYVENTGTAVPLAGVLHILGGTGIATSGTGSTVTINADATVPLLFTENTGTAAPALNNLNIVGGTGITTSGSGSTVTINATGGTGSVVTQVFTSSGTYTPTAGMDYCIVEAVGAGGGGGASSTTGSGTVSVAAGGGGGGYTRKTFTAAEIGVSQVITIGAGGIAGVAPAGTGGNGGTTTFGALLTATGGAGGNGASAAATIAQQGAPGGTGSGGDFGTHGNPSPSSFGIGSLDMGYASGGGSSFFGGAAMAQGGTVASGNVGTNGNSYGGGAGGSYALNSTSGANGGTGFGGIIVITEFVSI